MYPQEAKSKMSLGSTDDGNDDSDSDQQTTKVQTVAQAPLTLDETTGEVVSLWTETLQSPSDIKYKFILQPHHVVQMNTRNGRNQALMEDAHGNIKSTEPVANEEDNLYWRARVVCVRGNKTVDDPNNPGTGSSITKEVVMSEKWCGLYLCENKPLAPQGNQAHSIADLESAKNEFISLRACSNYHDSAKFTILPTDGKQIASLYTNDNQRLACFSRVQLSLETSADGSIGKGFNRDSFNGLFGEGGLLGKERHFSFKASDPCGYTKLEKIALECFFCLRKRL